MKLGAVPSPPDSRDYKARDYIAMGIRPTEYTPPLLANVVSQKYSDCVAQTLALIKSYQEHRERNVMQQYSAQFIYQNRKDGQYKGEGMIPREALSNLVTDGVPLASALTVESEYSDAFLITDAIREIAKPQIISSYASCDTADEICNCVWANSPVAIMLPVYDSFYHFLGWKVPLPDRVNEQMYGYHEVAVIGYTSEGLMIQNSWGEYWGRGGFALLPFDYPIMEKWIIIDSIKEWDSIELWLGQRIYRRNGIEGELDTAPLISNGRTMVPIRFIAEAFGASVGWDPLTKKITILRER